MHNGCIFVRIQPTQTKLLNIRTKICQRNDMFNEGFLIALNIETNQERKKKSISDVMNDNVIS